MELMLTAVTANRKLGKAQSRTQAFQKRLSELVNSLSHPDWDDLLVVMDDRPSSFIKEGFSKGRIRQMVVGTPESALSFGPADDPKFVDGCAAQLSFAIKAVEMSDELRAMLLKFVEQARMECCTGERT